MNPSSTFQSLTSVFKWVFFRLPAAFSISFAVLAAMWTLFGFHFLYGIANAYQPVAWILGFLPEPPRAILIHYLSGLDRLLDAVFVCVGFFIGFLVAYNVAVFISRQASRSKSVHYPVGLPQPPQQDAVPTGPFASVERIGIVLAGGGAKGAFQAGAMRAIYEYLERHNALGKVKVIASTSIGSWNALFWLAHLVKPDGKLGAQSVHEAWWKAISAKSLVTPHYYAPFFSHAFLSPEPWQQVFDRIFGQEEVKKLLFESMSNIHFYMTRSNVRNGQLECATNNHAAKPINKVHFDPLYRATNADEFLDRIKTAVFASMDLPPLFPYMECNGELYEDGGVIDNLPISFAGSEGCDLVFVLPLNSDFEAEPNTTSVIVRLNRVLDVQQGALERHGFKLLYLYNELAVLKERIDELERQASQPVHPTPPPTHDPTRLEPLEFAMRRKHKSLRVFAVCPHKLFVHNTINTRELWNTVGAGKAFDVMYGTTSKLLEAFGKKTKQDRVEVAVVTRGGQYTLDERF
jgi:NTE family protein